MTEVHCGVLLVKCLVGAAAGIGVIAFCWRLRRPLKWAQSYDGQITEDKLYGELPIYSFLRRYLLLLLLSGFVALLISTIPVIWQLKEVVEPSESCELRTADPTVSVLFLLFGVHMSTIIWFETARHQRRNRKPYRVPRLVDDIRKRLWSIAVILLVAASLLIVLHVAVAAS